MGISPRNISLSSCGLVPRIDTLPQDAPHVTLSVSLHAPNDEIRNKLMPINKAYQIAEVLAAARRYAQTTGRRVVFEYALVKGLNDSQANANELAARLRGMTCHVNLIPLNPVEGAQPFRHQSKGSGECSENGLRIEEYPQPLGVKWEPI